MGSGADVLRELANNGDWRVRLAVAGNPVAPEDVLSRLAKDLESSVRRSVAANPGTPLAVLHALVGDADGGVSSAVPKAVRLAVPREPGADVAV
ncbi:MAG: hypothetical protein HY335_04055, partial [Deinococcus sp.]|nr:hypothetical protein [Deinococcus sp.]